MEARRSYAGLPYIQAYADHYQTRPGNGLIEINAIQRNSSEKSRGVTMIHAITI